MWPPEQPLGAHARRPGSGATRLDASSFHLLRAVRREAPEAYRQLLTELRAAVLVAALHELPQLNDFSLRRYPMPHEMRLGDAVEQQDRWTLTTSQHP